jgi:hypothetical protein
VKRRDFLRGAVVAGISANIPTAIKATIPARLGVEDFYRLAATGIVKGQTFYVDRTIVIGAQMLDGPVIENCRFIAVDGFETGPVLNIKKTVRVVGDLWILSERDER